MTTINDLSNEMLMEIFLYIDIQDRQRLTTVCKRWGPIIGMMWRTFYKLMLYIGPQKSPFSSWKSANIANISCRTIPDAMKVLNKFSGNLTRLDVECDGSVTNRFTVCDTQWNELCEEVQKNEQLNSVRISTSHLAETMSLRFLQCLSTKNLQHLFINEIDSDKAGMFAATLKTLVKTSPGLRYLNVGSYIPSMEGIISEIDTLESLHLGDWFGSHRGVYSAPNVIEFPNLRELSVINWDLVDDEFFIILGHNGKLMRALDLRCYEDLSQAAFDCIGKLENLSYLKLCIESSLDIEILCNLSNLEELYLHFGFWSLSSEKTQKIHRTLKNLPKLTQCWFYNDTIHEELKSNRIVDESVLKKPEDLNYTTWRRIFGF